MFITLFTFTQTGAVNKVPFSPFISKDSKFESTTQGDASEICAMLREDRESKMYGQGYPIDNPSTSPQDVKLFYLPVMEKQKLYQQELPINRGTYNIIDVFACLGSRFGLSRGWVFVEVCQSTMGGENIWVNIYEASNPEYPATIIHVHRATMAIGIDFAANKFVEHFERWFDMNFNYSGFDLSVPKNVKTKDRWSRLIAHLKGILDILQEEKLDSKK